MEELFEMLNSDQVDIALYQYLKNLKDRRTIVFNDDVTELILEKVYLPLREFELDDSTTPVTLIIHSSGGSVSDALFLANYLEHYKKPLVILVCGYACSMATVFLAAAAKNPNITRYCYRDSYALIHDGYVALGASEAGTAQDIMAFNHTVDTKIKKLFLDNTKITEEEYTQQARKQWFLFSEDMKKYGLIDKIIGEEEETVSGS